MIHHLNQITVQNFGSILSERTRNARDEEREEWKTMHLTCTDSPAFYAEDEVWLSSGSGSCVLSLSHDDRLYRHYYLDKGVSIQAGTYFVLSALWRESDAQISALVPPKAMGSRKMENVKVEKKLDVEGIYTFFYHEKESGFLFSGESHPMLELTYVDQGTLHSVADGLDLVLEQGDIALYGPNQWHMQYADIGVAPRYVTITFDAKGLDWQLLVNRKFAAPQKVVSLLQQMLREQEHMDEHAADVIISQLRLVLLHLLRQTAAPEKAKLQASNTVHSENEIIRRAQIYVSAHIREKLTVPQLARQVDVSPSYLTALFHKNLQISPGEYVRRIKLQESKQMIRENTLNFTEIAEVLQYSSVHHFSRQFKEKFGISPSEYAKSVR